MFETKNTQNEMHSHHEEIAGKILNSTKLSRIRKAKCQERNETEKKYYKMKNVIQLNILVRFSLKKGGKFQLTLL